MKNSLACTTLGGKDKFFVSAYTLSYDRRKNIGSRQNHVESNLGGEDRFFASAYTLSYDWRKNIGSCQNHVESNLGEKTNFLSLNTHYLMIGVKISAPVKTMLNPI